jgi:hypothetical protein
MRNALRAERSVCEGENGEWVQSAQRVKELIGGHNAFLENFLCLILKVDWETPLALTQRA